MHLLPHARSITEMSPEQKLKIIFVHGACHGAWNWYKVEAALRSEGHYVLSLDLAASGINKKRMAEDVFTFAEYSQPLMETLAELPQGEKAVLVGHSLGGLNLAFAMETFPQKIAVAVFVTAFMPDTVSPPPYVFSKLGESISAVAWMDTEFEEVRVPEREEPFLTMLFGPQFMVKHLYQLCSHEDLTLANSLIRTGSLFQEDLKKAPILSKEGYGSVDKVYIICKQDAAITEDYQRWMISNNPVKEVMEIEADHMVMLSRPQELCKHLKSIFNKYI
ncbi:hypothetical protein M5K25_012131 [Dendrobium thyrsiflorum]|uniref:AB hydrolase-1 domain-containing protein n=1 Tax=Dendrobium thyrsiflorum TaxID=117978 RepID=A0ABD0UW88_DENTH